MKGWDSNREARSSRLDMDMVLWDSAIARVLSALSMKVHGRIIEVGHFREP